MNTESQIWVEKVVAYITSGDRLLVFNHPKHPEAGIQVPGGTIEPDESPAEAVLREAQEETGLDNLEIRSFLGIQELDCSPVGIAEIHRRHVYHLELIGEAPETWRHWEHYPSDGSPGPIEFGFYWVKYPGEVPELSGLQGALLGKLPAHEHEDSTSPQSR